MCRRAELAIRVPEATSLGRASAFNQFTRDKFMDNVEKVYERNEFTPDRTYNCDETAVHRPDRIIATKGAKQVDTVTSHKSGQLLYNHGLYD